MTPKQYIEELEKGCYEVYYFKGKEKEYDCCAESLCPKCKEKVKDAKQMQKLCNKSHDDSIKRLKDEFFEDWTNANGKIFTLDEVRNKLDNLQKEQKKEMGQ